MAQHTSKRDLYQEITDKVIAIMESGRIPWRKEWRDERDAKGIDLAIPCNPFTGRNYHGINTILLWGAQAGGNYERPVWLTYKQAQKAGGQVKRGEKGTTVIFWKRLPIEETDSTGERHRKVIPLLRSFTVFNIAQCEDVKEPKVRERAVRSEWENLEPIEHATAFFAEVGATVRQGGGPSSNGRSEAYYSPVGDYIGMPFPRQFSHSEAYYATLAHEHTHWTGAKHRLDRTDFHNRFGSKPYAFEELVAELGAAFTCAHLGIGNTLENHAAYLQSWVDGLREDKRAIFKAATLAGKAANYLLEAAGEPVDTYEEKTEEEERQAA